MAESDFEIDGCLTSKRPFQMDHTHTPGRLADKSEGGEEGDGGGMVWGWGCGVFFGIRNGFLGGSAENPGTSPKTLPRNCFWDGFPLKTPEPFQKPCPGIVFGKVFR